MCRLLAILFALSLSLASHASRNLLGGWVEYKNDKKVSRAEFFKDGTYMIEVGGNRLSGKWVTLDDGRIKMDLSMLGSSTLMFAKINGDEMTVDGGPKKSSVMLRENSPRMRDVEAQIGRRTSEKQQKDNEAKKARETAEQNARVQAQEYARRRVQAMAPGGFVKEITWTTRDVGGRPAQNVARFTESFLWVKNNAISSALFGWYGVLEGFTEDHIWNGLQAKTSCSTATEFRLIAMPKEKQEEFLRAFEEIKGRWRQRHPGVGSERPQSGYCANDAIGYRNSIPVDAGNHSSPSTATASGDSQEFACLRTGTFVTPVFTVPAGTGKEALKEFTEQFCPGGDAEKRCSCYLRGQNTTAAFDRTLAEWRREVKQQRNWKPSMAIQ